MDNKKSPKGRKRTSKGILITPGPVGGTSTEDDNFWDCSVCTFRNHAEAFKCSMCDVRKGTSTRKPRINPDLVAAQQAQALTPPPLSTTPTPSSSNSVHWSGDESGTLGGIPEEEPESAALGSLKSNKKLKEPKSTKKKEATKKTNSNTIPRLKNVDRSSATYHSVTVNDFTIVITEFKPKVKKEKKPKPPNKASATTGHDEDNSRTSRSPSVSCDGIPSDENTHPNGHAVANSSLDSSGGF